MLSLASHMKYEHLGLGLLPGLTRACLCLKECIVFPCVILHVSGSYVPIRSVNQLSHVCFNIMLYIDTLSLGRSACC